MKCRFGNILVDAIYLDNHTIACYSPAGNYKTVRETQYVDPIK
jgi:hypothetical protein